MISPTRRAGGSALPARLLIFASSAAVVGLPLLAGCTDNTPTGGASAAASSNPRALTVQATDTECKLSAASAPAGALTFAVSNAGTKVDGVLPVRRGRQAHRR